MTDRESGAVSSTTPTGPFPSGTSKESWKRQEVEQVLGTLEDLKENQEKIKNERRKRKSYEELKKENRELKNKLDKYERSVPLPVYGALLSGLLISIFGYLFASDLIYFVGGICILLVAITAILESKLRGGRVN